MINSTKLNILQLNCKLVVEFKLNYDQLTLSHIKKCIILLQIYMLLIIQIALALVVTIERCITPLNIRGIKRHLKICKYNRITVNIFNLNLKGF